MEDMKVTLKDIVTKRLSAAPDSTAKAELIEELSENLFSRYTDLTASGISEEEARDRAVDALGDTDELVEYLKGLEPDQPLPGPVPETDGSQIDEILHNVEDILRGAFHKAKSALRDTKEAITLHINSDTEQNADEVTVHINSQQETDEAPVADTTEKVEVTVEKDTGSEKGWKVTYENKSGETVEFGSDDLKDSVKDMMKDIEQVIREATGMAKDVTKSACKVAKEGSRAAWHAAREGSRAAWDAAAAACTPDSPVEADQPIDATQLKVIDVQTYGGDITVRMSQEPDGNVIVGGDIEDIEVFRSADGTLTVRPIKTETASFFFGRGIFNSSSSADVILDLPRREWESLKLSTTNGDVELSGEFPVDHVVVTSVSGDINVALPSCGKAVCRTTNGDIRWNGDVSDFRMESISGDVMFRGSADSVVAKSTSGDLTAEGTICAASARTVSGDVCLRSNVLPGKIDVATTSGDTWVDIPDEGPFTAHFRSTSGDFTSDFFTGRMGGRSCVFNYRGGGECQYNFASISGDVEIRKYR